MISKKRATEIEKMIAKVLNMLAVIGSGNTPHDKEDIKNDKYLGQIKATDTMKGNFNLLDLNKLERNSIKANKIPLMIIHFEREELINSTWVSMPIQCFKEMSDKIDKD